MAQGTATTRKRTKKKVVKTGGGTAPAKPAPDLGKKKGDGPPGPPKAPKPAQKARTAKEDVNAVLQDLFGDPKVFDAASDSDSEDGPVANRVTAALAFDRAKLTQLAKTARKDATKLTKDSEDKYFKAAAASLKALNDRLVKTRQIADRIARIQLEAGKVGSGLELTDPELSDAYKRFEQSIGVSDTTAAENWLTTIEGRIAQIPGIIQTYNQKTAPAAPVRRIPAALLKAAGTFSPLVTLTEALAHVPARIPTVAALIPLLAGADKPEKVPVLIGLAHAANVALADVFHEFPADTKGDTAKAEAALTTIRDSGQNADFFLTGRGGQGWGDLRFAGEKQAPVWNDDQIARTDVHFGPLTKPTTTLAVIKAAAQSPAPGKKKLAPLQQEDPDNPRYMKKEYGNLGVKRCMILPYVTGTGHRIYYTEYDIRPYEGTKRGRERVVVGTDGRSYYTADHYKTFQEIR